jgi:hypothetical protein
MKHLFLMICALAVLGSPAQADWTAMDPARGLGEGAVGCLEGGGNFQCLALRCKDGQTSLALIATGGDFGQGEQMPAYVRVDGGPAVRLNMTPLVTSGTLEAEVAYDPIAHAGLVADLMRGSRVTVSIWQNDPDLTAADGISLRGSSKALSHAQSVCPMSMAGATPNTDTERFVAMFEARGGDQAEELARKLLANDIQALGPEADLVASLLTISDARSLLVAQLGFSASIYGMSGFGVYVFALQGEDARLVFPGAGTAVWADLDNLTGGWPDLWFQSVRGADPAFNIWRWADDTYTRIGEVR